MRLLLDWREIDEEEINGWNVERETTYLYRIPLRKDFKDFKDFINAGLCNVDVEACPTLRTASLPTRGRHPITRKHVLEAKS